MRVKCQNPACKKIVEIPDDALRCYYCGAPYCEYGVNLKEIKEFYQCFCAVRDKRCFYFSLWFSLRLLAVLVFGLVPGMFFLAYNIDLRPALGFLVFLFVTIFVSILGTKQLKWAENKSFAKFPLPIHPQGIDP